MPPGLAGSPSSGDSADDLATLEAQPDGVRLAELVELLPLSRGSIFELIRALGIVTSKGPGLGGRGRVAWLSGPDAEKLRQASQEVAAGRLRIADVGGLVQRHRTPPALATLPDSESPDSGAAADPSLLLQRLEAADRAIRSGFPLSSAEVALILGIRPGGPVVIRAGIVARRLARNLWRLESAASPDSAGPGRP